MEHALGDWVVTKEATCTDEGERVKKCNTCNESIIVESIAAGHKFDTDVVIKEADCLENGSAKRICKKCGVTFDVVIPALGHAYGESVVTKEPTFTESGESQRTCEKCGDVIKTIIPMLSTTHVHDFSGTVEVIKEPTSQEKGITYIHCTEPECKEYKIVETAPVDKTKTENTVTTVTNSNANAGAEKQTASAGNTGKNTVNTGDQTNVILWFSIFGATGIVLFSIVLTMLRMNNKYRR